MTTESKKDKFFQVAGQKCIEGKRGWWFGWDTDCAVPLLAGMFADSEICWNVWEEQK